jgi:hypothetical protein
LVRLPPARLVMVMVRVMMVMVMVMMVVVMISLTWPQRPLPACVCEFVTTV